MKTFIYNTDPYQKFRFNLTEEFLKEYKHKQPDWGPLGYVTAKRTYCRNIPEENRTEEWWEVIKRVVEGEFTIQKRHCLENCLFWEDEKAKKSAQETFKLMWDFKFLPPGRGLWMMGTQYVLSKGGMALNNCAFASTENIDFEHHEPFCWTMDALMQGVGVGFDTRGADKLLIYSPSQEKTTFVIPDTREGWVEALKRLINSYTLVNKETVDFDYSKIRQAGVPIKGFGGVASGPEPLREMLDNIKMLLDNKADHQEKLNSVDIVDIFNYIAKCVVAGNVRRSAQIAIGQPYDLKFVECKQDEEALNSHRWASNNSVFATPGMNYDKIANMIATNGEPGVVFLENMRKYGRMGRKADWLDKKAVGTNPCLVGETIIQTTSGMIRLDELVKRFNKGEEFDVYSMDQNGNLEIVPVLDAFKTKETRDIYRLEMTNSEVIYCTPEHKFFVYEKKEIKQVCAKDIDPKKHIPIYLQRIRKSEKYFTRNKSGPRMKFKRINKVPESCDYFLYGDKEVYDLVVFKNNNFLANGVLVHNCGEQTLEDRELCCLVETFPSRHENYEDYQHTLKYAYIYGKTVTLLKTAYPKTNNVMQKNKRIGISQTGIIDAFVKHGRRSVLNWADKGYKFLKNIDKKYSNDWLCVQPSKKLTSVKPSGTVSLLPGVSPGIHYPHSEYYIRRIRFAKNSKLLPVLEGAGYDVYGDPYAKVDGEYRTFCVDFPVHEKNFDRSKESVSMWEQVANAVDYQKHWADNQVSITVTFNKNEAKDIKYLLQSSEDKVKGMAMLPLLDHNYKAAPYESITKDKYVSMKRKIKPFNLDSIRYDLSSGLSIAKGVKGCKTDVCEIKQEIASIGN